MTAAVALAALALVALVLSRRVYGDVASPIAIATVVWSATTGLYALRLLPYIDVSRRTWAITATSVICLAAGLALGERWVRGGARPTADAGGAPRSGAADALVRARGWIPVYGLAAMAGLAWYFWNVQHYLGWDAFGDGQRIRRALGRGDLPSSFLFIEYFCIVTPLVAMAIRLAGVRLRAVDMAAAAAAAAGTWLSTDRTQFFTLTLAGGLLLLYARGHRLSWTRLAIGAGLAALALTMNFTIVARWVAKASPKTSAYVYATASFPAWEQAVSRPPSDTRGVRTFYPIARLLQRLHVIDGPLPRPVLDFVPVTRDAPGKPLLFNGYTWLFYPYEDWGVAGMLAYAGVVGLLGGVLYGRLRLDRTRPVPLLLMAQFSTALVLTPFVNKFNNTGSWYIAVLSMLPFAIARLGRRAP